MYIQDPNYKENPNAHEHSIYKDVNLDKYKNIYFYKDDCIKYNQINYKSRYYTFYGIGNIKDACKKYIEGLYWVLGYYNGHMHNNWLWYYKYMNVPFASDISEYLRNRTDVKRYIMDSQNLEKSKRITSMQQLWMVLPKESLMEVLEDDILMKLKRLLKMKDVMNKYFPEDICVDIINKEYLWQSKVFLEDFDINILEMIL
jgi:5'-3' exonuclease